MPDTNERHRRYRVTVAAIVVVAIALVVAGCWDYVNLEQYSLIMGLAVDFADDEADELLLTVEIPVPAAAEPGSDGAGGDVEPKFIASAQGVSLLEAANKLRGRMQRHPLWQQVVAIIVSEDVARDGLAPIGDVVMRFHNLNMRAHLYIVEGSAEEVLHFEPPMQPMSAVYLRGAAEQFDRHPRFPRPEAFVIFSREIRDKRVALVPRLQVDEEELRMEGAAVIVDGKLLGWLDADEVEGANWIRGWVKRSFVRVACPGHPEGHIAAWVVLNHHRIHTSAKGDTPVFDVEMSFTARLVDLSRCPLSPESKEHRDAIADDLINLVTERAVSAVRYGQEQLQVDILALGEQWRRRYPSPTHHDDWEVLFPQAEINVKVSMSPTGIGFPGQLRETVPYF